MTPRLVQAQRVPHLIIMKTYQITLSSADVPYVMEAIALRAMSLQHEIQRQINENEQRLLQAQKPIVVPQESKVDAEVEAWHKEIKKAAKTAKSGSRAKKKAALMQIIKENPDLSTAEIARRAKVSYVTAHKARKA